MTTPPSPTGIDPRGPRFAAAITAVLLLVVVAISLASPAVSTPAGRASSTLASRALEPGLLLLVVLAALFAWGAVRGVSRHPYSVLFRRAIRPRLAAPRDLEDPAPPRFAQGVGLAVTALGIILHLAGVPFALPAAAGAAFVAAFLNAVFDYCLGCEIHLILVRAGVLGRGSRTPASLPQ